MYMYQYTCFCSTILCSIPLHEECKIYFDDLKRFDIVLIGHCADSTLLLMIKVHEHVAINWSWLSRQLNGTINVYWYNGQ